MSKRLIAGAVILLASLSAHPQHDAQTPASLCVDPGPSLFVPSSAPRKSEDAVLALIETTNDEAVLRVALKGALINQSRSKHGTRAILYAAGLGNLVALQLLIAAGADVNIADKYGFNALNMSLGQAQFPATCLLVEAGARLPDTSKEAYLLPLAATSEHFEAARKTIEFMLMSGFDVDAKAMGDTALLIAAQLGNTALVDTLLEHGADATLTNNRGETAEAVALRFAHPAIAQRIARARVGH